MIDKRVIACIDALKPGDGLDSVVHKRIFGGNGNSPPFSEDISSAFRIAEAMSRHPDEILLSVSLCVHGTAPVPPLPGDYYWKCSFRQCRGRQQWFYAYGETIPLAICRAALVVSVEYGKNWKPVGIP